MLRAEQLKKEDYETLNLIQESNKLDITDYHVREWLRCRDNPLYFILNYVYLPVVGVRKVKYTQDLFHPKFRRVVRTTFKYHRCIMMASRQLGKSSIAACLLAWALVFFPNNSAVVLNMRKDAAQGNLKKVKYIINHLPEFMRVPSLSKSDIKSYLELQNGSRIDTYYPSSTHPPDTLARSLTVPILYIDETAFIPHIDEIYGSAQPTLARAREQAVLAGYPWFILMTSTPNGIEGTGRFFYEMWLNSIESDDLFVYNESDKIEDWVQDCESKISDSSKNGFIRVKYHWSEDFTKDLSWYEEQKKELNFDRRKINQELDLMFVGGSNCIFDDETLTKLIPVNKKYYVDLSNQVKLSVYNDIDPNDYYLIGVDTASSIKGAFNAVEVFSYKEFVQIAEVNVRLGSLVKYAETIDSLFRWLYKIVGPRIILCIENNSIGKAIIEHLLYHISDINYASFMYSEANKSEYGINTNSKTKELMVSLLYDHIKSEPWTIKSSDFISQLSTIQRSNRGTISSTGFSDMFMAASFCAYVRKMKMLEILPLLNYTNDQIEQNFFNTIKETASIMNTKIIIKEAEKLESNVFNISEDNDMFVKEIEFLTSQDKNDKLIADDLSIYMPFFNPLD